MDKIRGIVTVIIGAASFGVLSTFVKKAYAKGFTLGEVTGVQAFYGAVLLCLLVLILKIFKPSYFQKYASKSSKWTILFSGISTGAVSILYYKCVGLVPASLAIVLLMQYIWIGQLLAFIFFRSIPNRKQLIGTLVILCATLLATGVFEHDFQSISISGIVYGFLAATCYAIFIMVNARVGNDHPPIQKSAFMVIGACIFVFLLFQPFSIFERETFSELWPYGLLLSTLGTVLPPVLFAYGMPKTGIPVGSILSAIELPVAVCLSYFVLNENVSLLQFFGVACILITITIVNLSAKEKN